MFKILFIDKFEQKEVLIMKGVPRVGDLIPWFYTPTPKVDQVIWLPGKLQESFEDYDVVIHVK